MALTEESAARASAARPDGRRWLAAGGMLGALLASACCLGPLLLLTLGISGAWIGTLTALEPYKELSAVVALGFIAAGFRQVYFRKPVACEPGSYCAMPASARITKTALWAALVLVVAALTIDGWAVLLY
jgi:mercuric ion transport protein